jgi:hypothetical protein
MRNTISRIIKFALGITVLTATLGNSGCLVQPGSDLNKLKKLNQDYLRIYQAGDRIKYDVLVDGNIPGTLTISYDKPATQTEYPLVNPFDTNSAIRSVLKETTVLVYTGNEVNTARYFSQDSDPTSPTYGSITLYAFRGQSSTMEHNYVNINTTADINNPPKEETVFSSPFLDATTFQPMAGQADESIDYYVLPCFEQSKPGTCDPYNQRLTETFQFSKMQVKNLTNKVDFFETVQVPYNGTVQSYGGVTDLRQVYLDFRTFCGNPTDSPITYSGSEFLYPSIGPVRFEVNCSSLSYHSLTADISSVNFSY